MTAYFYVYKRWLKLNVESLGCLFIILYIA
nr:MAG TPA: hypothetical protein [Caudoviricetes sp.]